MCVCVCVCVCVCAYLLANGVFVCRGKNKCCITAAGRGEVRHTHTHTHTHTPKITGLKGHYVEIKTQNF